MPTRNAVAPASRAAAVSMKELESLDLAAAQRLTRARRARCRWRARRRGAWGGRAPGRGRSRRAAPSCRGPRRVPAVSTTSRRRVRRPRRAGCAGRPRPAPLIGHLGEPAVGQLDLGTTASAPAGSGAPVMIRTAVPGPRAYADDRPGRDVADDREDHRDRPRDAERDVLGADGVAVHRGVVEGRQARAGRRRPRPGRSPARRAAGGRSATAARSASRQSARCASTLFTAVRPRGELREPGAQRRPEVLALAARAARRP